MSERTGHLDTGPRDWHCRKIHIRAHRWYARVELDRDGYVDAVSSRGGTAELPTAFTDAVEQVQAPAVDRFWYDGYPGGFRNRAAAGLRCRPTGVDAGARIPTSPRPPIGTSSRRPADSERRTDTRHDRPRPSLRQATNEPQQQARPGHDQPSKSAQPRTTTDKGHRTSNATRRDPATTWWRPSGGGDGPRRQQRAGSNTEAPAGPSTRPADARRRHPPAIPASAAGAQRRSRAARRADGRHEPADGGNASPRRSRPRQRGPGRRGPGRRGEPVLYAFYDAFPAPTASPMPSATYSPTRSPTPGTGAAATASGSTTSSSHIPPSPRLAPAITTKRPAKRG